jgi:hypothetical protein
LKLKDLLSEERVLETEIAERQEELRAVRLLIRRERQREGLPETITPTIPHGSSNGKQRRTRGTLKAAKLAIDNSDLPVEFTRQQLFKKIEEANPALAGKISAEAIRGTMRTLISEGFIKLIDGRVSEETGEALYRQRAPLIRA